MACRTLAPSGGAVVALVAAVLAVAGCTGSGDGTASPTTGATSPTSVTSTPSPTTASASPTEAAALPPLPDAATENTPEGAEAFIRYYIDVANLAHTGPQTGLVDQLSSQDCLSCQEMEAQVVALEAQGQRLESAPYEILEMERVGGGPPGVQQFRLDVRVVANAYLDAAGETASEYESVSLGGVGAAVWEEGRWLIYDMGLQAS